MTIDVAAFIDRRAVGWFQIRTLLLCLSVALADGYDAQVMGYVIPSLARAWGLDRSAFGAIFSVGFAGLLLWLPRLRPRRRPFRPAPHHHPVHAALQPRHFGDRAGTVRHDAAGAAFPHRTGVGGAIPNIIALMVEYSPRRRRSTMTTLIQCGISIGSAMVGFLVAPLLPRFGWQTAFYIGSLFPLTLLPLLLLYLPESLRFLVVRQRPRAQIAAILAVSIPASASTIGPISSPPSIAGPGCRSRISSPRAAPRSPRCFG